jgi:hypothetical protein
MLKKRTMHSALGTIALVGALGIGLAAPASGTETPDPTDPNVAPAGSALVVPSGAFGTKYDCLTTRYQLYRILEVISWAGPCYEKPDGWHYNYTE